ncbi:hypothetical protein COU59_00200 [Candidatus Pacearchaeota archaeon CG10_big_fil_rev_8_21_14_0_10_34_12]|nr:MAG: hypothetical protein COU59_00200 [Candidatus Pacearchaeota archaeon CG10_big_fil_rev_8_21_14_0_10_34_12]
MKKEGIIIALFLFVIMFSSSVFAAGENCTITTRASCSAGNIVLGLSNYTNAHGELASEGNYNYVLCCNFAGSTTCTGSNKVLGLSSATNAHAEQPNGTAYLTDVCYEQLTVTATTENCGENLSIASLTDFTNAHIGGINDYDIKLCGTSPNFGPGESAFWSSNGLDQISSLEVVPGTSKVKLILKNSQLSQGTVVNLDIREKDLFFDDEIRTLTATIGVNGSAETEWTITSEDLAKTENNDYSQFYFSVNSKESNYLSISMLNISTCSSKVICSDYTTKSSCEADTCQIFSNSAPSNLNCNDPNVNCFCGWDSDKGKCGFNFETSNPETNVTLGKCVFAESTGDDCSDGFLSYSWVTSWTGNTEDRPAACIDGTRVLECPAQIQLPFFGVWNFFLASLVIAIVYLVMLIVKRNRK